MSGARDQKLDNKLPEARPALETGNGLRREVRNEHDGRVHDEARHETLPASDPVPPFVPARMPVEKLRAQTAGNNKTWGKRR